MQLHRFSGTVVALVVTLGLLSAPSTAAPAPVSSLAFSGSCRDVRGELLVRETSVDARTMRVSLLATGLRDQRWNAELVIQPHRFAQIATFEGRSRDHRLRRSVVFDVPTASTTVTASLFDFDRQVGCDLSGAVDDDGAIVSGGALDLSVWTLDTDTALIPSASCAPGSTWRVRATATYGDGDVRRFTDTGRCRHGVLWRAMIDLPDIGVPRALEAVVRDGVGRAGRASYQVTP